MKAMIAICILLFGFIYYAEGVVVNPFAIWNALPLAFALFFYWIGTRNRDRAIRWAAIGFLVVSMGLSVFGHLAWMFDWDGTKTGSSTSALLFVVLPVYSSGVGFLGFGLVLALGRWVGRRRH